MTLKRSSSRRRPRDTGPTAEVVALVWERDFGRCAVDGEPIDGERGMDWSVQHRVRRGAGSTRRPWINQPGNLILACGSATTKCHGWIEEHPGQAEALGYRVRDGITLPADVRVFHVGHGGWVLLTDEGGVVPCPTD